MKQIISKILLFIFLGTFLIGCDDNNEQTYEYVDYEFVEEYEVFLSIYQIFLDAYNDYHNNILSEEDMYKICYSASIQLQKLSFLEKHYFLVDFETRKYYGDFSGPIETMKENLDDDLSRSGKKYVEEQNKIANNKIAGY